MRCTIVSLPYVVKGQLCMSNTEPSHPVGAAHFGARLGIARRLRSNALRRDVTRVEIGDHVGVSGQTVGMWENGTTRTDILTIERVAAFLNISPGWLAFGEGVADPAMTPAVRRPARPMEPLEPGTESLADRRWRPGPPVPDSRQASGEGAPPSGRGKPRPGR